MANIEFFDLTDNAIDVDTAIHGVVKNFKDENVDKFLKIVKEGSAFTLEAANGGSGGGVGEFYYVEDAVKGEIFNTTGEYSKTNPCVASGPHSHAEGCGAQATHAYAHAEGNATLASNVGSHAEGLGTRATGVSSHAGGTGAQAIGNQSFAHGSGGSAVGTASVVLGSSNVAEGNYSVAIGFGAYAKDECSIALGKYNVDSTGYVFQIGNGTGYQNRSDIMNITKSGTMRMYGNIIADGSIQSKYNNLSCNTVVATEYYNDLGAVRAIRVMGEQRYNELTTKDENTLYILI